MQSVIDFLATDLQRSIWEVSVKEDLAKRGIIVTVTNGDQQAKEPLNRWIVKAIESTSDAKRKEFSAYLYDLLFEKLFHNKGFNWAIKTHVDKITDKAFCVEFIEERPLGNKIKIDFPDLS
ncbi:hypothetical protein [Tellurirhabdus bombi]|uniref:hypothetical protein n=1 Tax=Tellurirhabdus bombi TaxID=2907205 RepID=UPI001F473C9D|nr:hypothetical protein [Tellurirhabdus bombi]